MGRGVSCLGIALFIAVSSATARAAGAPPSPPSPEARLFYTRGAGVQRCPDERALRRAVEARAGSDPFVSDTTLSIRVELAKEGERLRARITIADDGVEKGSQLLEQAVS